MSWAQDKIYVNIIALDEVCKFVARHFYIWSSIYTQVIDKVFWSLVVDLCIHHFLSFQSPALSVV